MTTARLLLLAILGTLLPAAYVRAADAPPAQPAPEQVAPAPAPLTREQSDFFESKVRPILVSACYKCHSAEEKRARGGLLVDSREGWHKGGESGPAIVPGDVAGSLLLKAVRYEDADLQMPPDGAKLSDEQIATLEQWVRMGAPDPRVGAAGVAGKLTGLTDEARAHWAFQPVKKPAVPSVKNGAWVKTPVDAFVLATLEASEMTPAAPASKEALIRRATYDLIGLPPTPEEVASFVKDPSPDAFDKVIERLLASPHYGERWGRYWLDTARYSDTTGGEDRRSDYRYPFAWTYRDYVINSFNADKPYDQFLKEQIAADQLHESKEDPRRLAALGFITVGKRFQNPNDTIDERIDTLTKATLGLTVACARCHDHKFDPVPTADYYSLHGVFASTVEPVEKPLIEPEPTGGEYDQFKRRMAELEEKNREIYFDLVATKSAEFRKKAGAYALAAALGRRNGGSAERIKLRNSLVAEFRLDRDIYQNGLRNAGRPNDPVFGALMRFIELPEQEFADKATDVLAAVVRGGDRRRPINSLVAKAFADVPTDSLRSLRDVADVYTKLFTGLDEQARAYLKAARSATVAPPGAEDGDDDAPMAVAMEGRRGGRMEMRAMGMRGMGVPPPPVPAVPGFDPAVVELLNVPAEIVPHHALSTEKIREIAPRLPVVNGNAYQRFRLAEINELQLTNPVSPARAMAVADAPRPRNSPIFIRGEQQNRGAIVPRQFLAVLSGPNRKPFSVGSGRLELANAIASKDNPLTARVMVNRIWMHHFGQAFVRTPDDLGVMSEKPSHPELLDYLASEFVEQGWSIKQMHRLVMRSSAYQQSSDTNPAFAQKDPENRLLWRANLRRLDFEAVRDTMLMFTGKLDRTLGGKPVNLTDEPYSNRRSVYGYIDRGALPELLDQFDFADPDMANSRRVATIVPQQALFFMNSPMAVDVAMKVTSREEFKKARDSRAKVVALYEVLFQRTPRPEEIRLALDFVKAAGRQSNEDEKDEDVVASAAVLSPGESQKATSDARPASDSRKPRNPRAEMERNRRQMREQAMKEREKRRAMMQAQQRRGNGRSAIRNEGDRVDRRPLTPWEQYAQALLFSNELVYVN